MHKTVIASAIGMAAGAGLAVAALGGVATHNVAELLLHLAIRMLPLICGLVIVACFFRSWMEEFTRQTRAEMAASTQERRQTEGRLHERAQYLDTREEALARSAQATERRLALLNRRLEDTQRTLLSERAKHSRLQAEHDELAEDYNRMVISTLQQRADFFNRSPAFTIPGIPAPVRRITSRQYDDGAAHHQARDAADPNLS